MESNKYIKYELVRKISLNLEDGFYTSDPTTGKETGFLVDKNIKELKQGQVIYRTVEESDGDNSFDTRTLKDPTQSIYLRVFTKQTTGRIRDIMMSTYPFDQGDDIQITTKCYEGNWQEGSIIKITIETKKEVN